MARVPIKRRHDCSRSTNGMEWANCCVCDGRMHMEGCTTRRDPKKDCCKARHRMLYDQGQIRGIADPSHHMLADYEPEELKAKSNV